MVTSLYQEPGHSREWSHQGRMAGPEVSLKQIESLSVILLALLVAAQVGIHVGESTEARTNE